MAARLGGFLITLQLSQLAGVWGVCQHFAEGLGKRSRELRTVWEV
jgi:hypothetical protein